MRGSDDDPAVGLVGWGLGGPGLLSARAAALVTRADAVLAGGALEGFDPADRRVSQSPADPREAARELAGLADRGRRAVWVAAGDPLEDATGADVARWLTALGVAWEYAPASAACAASAG